MNLHCSTIFFFIFSTFIIIQAKEYINTEEYKEFQEFKEFEEFKKWKKEKELTSKLNVDHDDKSKSYEQSLLLRNKFNDDNSEEISNKKQKWKDKKLKENYKNKDYSKKKNYNKLNDDDDDEEEEEKNYELENNKQHGDKMKKYKKQNEQKKKKYDKYIDKINQESLEKINENSNDPPPINEAALMARYIVNQASKYK